MSDVVRPSFKAYPDPGRVRPAYKSNVKPVRRVCARLKIRTGRASLHRPVGRAQCNCEMQSCWLDKACLGTWLNEIYFKNLYITRFPLVRTQMTDLQARSFQTLSCPARRPLPQSGSPGPRARRASRGSFRSRRFCQTLAKPVCLCARAAQIGTVASASHRNMQA